MAGRFRARSPDVAQSWARLCRIRASRQGRDDSGTTNSVAGATLGVDWMKRGDRFVQWVIQRRNSRRRVVVISRSWRWRRARSAAICVEMFDPLCRGECSENAVLCCDVQCCADKTLQKERERATERQREREKRRCSQGAGHGSQRTFGVIPQWEEVM